MDKDIARENYELQKAHQGSTETVKLQCFHLPYRLFLALAFIFDIVTDIIVILELFDNDIDQNGTALLVFICIGFFGMMLMNCANLNTTSYPANGCLRLIFALFGILGLDSIIYFIYSGLTLEGHTMHDHKINGPKSPRKLWGAWQSVLSSFITAHYVFYYPQASVWAVVSLFVSMLNARLNMNMSHTHETFLKLLKNDVFCMRFVSTFFEIIGRPLFYGATTIIIIKKSSFLDKEDNENFHLTYEFFAWDGIVLASVCVVFFIGYQSYFKDIKISLSLMIQNFLGSMLIRPAVDKNDLQSVKTVSKMVIFMGDKEVNPRFLKRQIQFGLGFPCVWRICEYIALNYVIYDYEFLSIAEERDDSILYLAYLCIVINIINSVILLYTIVVLLTVEPKFDKSLAFGTKIITNQIGIVREEREVDQKEGSLALKNVPSGIGNSDAYKIEETDKIAGDAVKE